MHTIVALVLVGRIPLRVGQPTIILVHGGILILLVNPVQRYSPVVAISQMMMAFGARAMVRSMEMAVEILIGDMETTTVVIQRVQLSI